MSLLQRRRNWVAKYLYLLQLLHSPTTKQTSCIYFAISKLGTGILCLCLALDSNPTFSVTSTKFTKHAHAPRTHSTLLWNVLRLTCCLLFTINVQIFTVCSGCLTAVEAKQSSSSCNWEARIVSHRIPIILSRITLSTAIIGLMALNALKIYSISILTGNRLQSNKKRCNFFIVL